MPEPEDPRSFAMMTRWIILALFSPVVILGLIGAVAAPTTFERIAVFAFGAGFSVFAGECGGNASRFTKLR